MKKYTSKQLLILFLGLMTLFRLFLFMRMPIHALADAMHDDQLLVQLAYHLQNGEWLGPYNNRTLVKGIAFPAFLAMCNLLNIPYLLAMGLLYTGSAAAFVFAIKTKIKNIWWLSGMYLFLLYSPAMLSSSTGQRVYNMSLLPAAVLLVAAGFIGMYFRRTEPTKKLIPYGLMAGLGFPFFWYLRDDSIWLLPFALGAALILGFCFLKEKGSLKQKLMRLLLPALPFFIWGCAHVGIAALNYGAYGTFTTNERTQSSQTDMMASLFRIESEKPAPSIWLTHETLNQVMEVSPTLASIRPQIDGMFQTSWAADSRAPGEIPGDIIVWAMRDAIYNAGCTDGASAASFCAQVNQEIETAFEEGLLKKSGAFFPSAISNGITSSDVLPLLSSMGQDLKNLMGYSYSYVAARESTGSREQIRFFESMTGGLALYPTEAPVAISGWAFSKSPSDILSLAVLNEEGEKITDLIMEDSSDLTGIYPDYPQAGRARFQTELALSGTDGLQLEVSINKEVQEVFPLTEASADNDIYALHLDQASASADSLTEQVQGLVNLSNHIIRIYQILGRSLFLLSCIGYLLLSKDAFSGLRKKTWKQGDMWLVTTALIGSCALLLAAVCWFTAFLAEGGSTVYYYSNSALTVIQIFQCLTLPRVFRR